MTDTEQNENLKPTIIYDGDCPLCQNAVKFLDAGKTESQFRFVAAADPSALKMLQKYQLPDDTKFKTVILEENNKIYIKSGAIIRSIQRKGGLWRMSGILLIIPKFIRDWIYDYIAAHRK